MKSLVKETAKNYLRSFGRFDIISIGLLEVIAPDIISCYGLTNKKGENDKPNLV
jgi:hypothetical protein